MSAVNYKAYSGVQEHGVVRLASGQWLGVVTAIVRKPGGGVPPTEDLRRQFDTEAEAQDWVADRIHRIRPPV